MKKAAVIDDARDQIYFIFRRGRKHKLAGPRFQGVENNHAPIKQRPKSLEAKNHVEGESVGRPRRDADAIGQLGVDKFAHARPDLVVAVASRIGIVQEQKIKLFDAAALQRFFRSHAQIIGVIAGRAE